MASEKNVSIINAGIVIDAQTGRVNAGYSQTDDSVTPSTSFPDDPPTYEDSANMDAETGTIEVMKHSDEDEKILAALRDVVRKCTNPNPAKRPTAQEVLRMLEEVAPKELLDERLELSSDDDDEDGDIKKLK